MREVVEQARRRLLKGILDNQVAEATAMLKIFGVEDSAAVWQRRSNYE
jgi:hypothetical protein